MRRWDGVGSTTRFGVSRDLGQLGRRAGDDDDPHSRPRRRADQRADAGGSRIPPDGLGKIADFYEDEVDASIQSPRSIIEPVLMIGVVAMVGTIVISMCLPMFKMLQLVK